MGYLEYCKKVDPKGKIKSGTYAAQQQLARYRRDEQLSKGEANGSNANLFQLATGVAHATKHAVEIAKMSRANVPVQPANFIQSFVRLEAWIDVMKAADHKSALQRWPKNPGITFAWKAGWSALDVAWKFSEMIYTSAIIARSRHRISNWDEPYASENATGECGEHISAWAKMAMNELCGATLSPDQVWPKMAEIHRDGDAIQYRIQGEYDDAVAAVNAGKADISNGKKAAHSRGRPARLGDKYLKLLADYESSPLSVKDFEEQRSGVKKGDVARAQSWQRDKRNRSSVKPI